MSVQRLLISGPNGAYRSGEAMLIRDGKALLGTVAPPEFSRDGTRVHFGHFSASPSVREGKRQYAPLMLVEVISFIAEHFPNIETIRFTLTRQVEMHGDGITVALARLGLLERIGASDLHMLPRPDSTTPGNFVIQGVWEYTGPNVAALAAEVARQRLAYFQDGHAAGAGRFGRLGHKLRQAWRRTKS